MKKIDNVEAKEIMLDILLQFSNFCEKHNLKYALGYGTLLGAIRHSGYIPWDNDIDVTMPRPDYEKFRELMTTTSVSENISCLDYKFCNTFPFLKLVDNRTILKEKFLRKDDGLGLYIDIFPLDGMPDLENERNMLLSKSRYYAKLFSFANYRFNKGSTLKIKIIKNVLYPFSYIMPEKLICKKMDMLCKNYNYNNSNYVANIVWDAGFPAYDKAIFDNLIKVKF